MNETVDNYLKGLYALSLKHPKGVSNSALAERMSTKASSVTDMLQKLGDKGLVKYTPYYGSHLTAKGKRLAVDVVRKHRLWEVFLVEKLGFAWDEVHDIAEQLEHVVSPELIARLDRYLGHPQFDPHGDPIPDAQGNVVDSRQAYPLADFRKGDTVQLAGVVESSNAFLQYLKSQNLKLGSNIKVLNLFDFDQSMLISHGNSEVTISHQVSKNLLATKRTKKA
jgi:DtxR family Mn-dependent transcriptional regulator